MAIRWSGIRRKELPVVITNLRTVPVPDPGGSPGSSPSTIFGTLYSQSELAVIKNYFLRMNKANII